jgi:hypothetical protein
MPTECSLQRTSFYSNQLIYKGKLMNIFKIVAAGMLAAALVTGAMPVNATPQTPSDAAIYATGLEAPRGLRFGPDGYLYIAEGGLGGTNSTGTTCQQVPGPVGPYAGGKTARISKTNGNGKLITVASGFPSAQTATGDILGVADVAFINGTLYALVAGGGCSHGNPQSPSGIARVDSNAHGWTLIADIGAFLKAHPTKYESADDFEPDGSLYSMISVDGILYTVEPNHGEVISVEKNGEIKQVIDISASEGHIVPTSIAYRNSAFYVGNLNLFPIDPQWARILTIARRGNDDDVAPGFDQEQRHYQIVNSKAGFTTVVAVDFGPDGLLYVLELSDQAGFPSPGTGRVLRVKHSGEIEEVVVGLVVPTGMTFGSDGKLYVANFGAIPAGALPPGSGQILQFNIAPGW